MKDLKPNEGKNFIIYNPKGYFLEGIKNKPIVSGSISCEDKNCTCICDKQKCSGEKNYCKEIDKELVLLNEEGVNIQGIIEVNVKIQEGYFVLQKLFK